MKRQVGLRLTCKTGLGYQRTRELTKTFDCEQTLLDKLGPLEDIEEWLSKLTFYGKAINEPNKILELKFKQLDFRPEENILLIHFNVLNSWATNIMYDIFEYGKMWAVSRGELE